MSNRYYTLQYTGAKTIQWKNFKDTSTPLSAANLQKSHQAIDDVDQAVNAGFESVDNTKFDKALAGSMLTGVTYNDETGQMVFHHYDNSIPDIIFNTNLQKLVVNFTYDPTTQKLKITQADGTVVPVDLSAFVANPDLQNSDTIAWTINQDGSISASVRNGSITDDMLESGFLADCTEQADAAEQSAENAEYYSKLAKSYANGTSNLDDRPTENVDNSKYFKEKSEAWAVGKKNGADVPSSDETYHNNAKYWAEQAAGSSGVNDMQGATSSAAGAHGLVPAPAAGDNTKFLRGDGTWQNASYNDFTGATSQADGAHGLVPQPLIADKDKFLKGDGSWSDVDLSAFTGATSSANGTKGMVPEPLVADKDKFLKGNGSWGTPTDTTYSAFTGATSQASGTEGLVTQPTAGDQNKFLSGGGIWALDTANLTTAFNSADNASETGIIVESGETTMAVLTSGNTHGGLFRIISKSILNTRKLISTVKRLWSSVSATWVSGHGYAVNDMVIYDNGHVYKCIRAHTSSSSILPTNTTYWTDTTLAAEIASLNSNYTNKVTADNVHTATGSSPYLSSYDIRYTKINHICTFVIRFTPNTNISSSIGKIHNTGLPNPVTSDFLCVYPCIKVEEDWMLSSVQNRFGSIKNIGETSAEIRACGSFESGVSYSYAGSYITT